MSPLGSLRLATSAMIALICAPGAEAADAYLRVVDVGDGLCVVARTPDGHTMLYDAGNEGGPGLGRCAEAVDDIVGRGRLGLVVLSHPRRHRSDAAAILNVRPVGLLVHPGDADVDTWAGVEISREVIADAVARGARDWNLAREPLVDGMVDATVAARRIVPLGGAEVIIMAGGPYGDRSAQPGAPPARAEARIDAQSVVVKFIYGGHAVLLTGDGVGRDPGDSETSCKYSEQVLVSWDAQWPLRSEVLVGQHHGEDVAGSGCFLACVAPEYVVVSPGPRSGPQTSALHRMASAGVPAQKVLQTGSPAPSCQDNLMGADIEILLPDDPAAPIRIRHARARELSSCR